MGMLYSSKDQGGIMMYVEFLSLGRWETVDLHFCSVILDLAVLPEYQKNTCNIF